MPETLTRPQLKSPETETGKMSGTEIVLSYQPAPADEIVYKLQQMAVKITNSLGKPGEDVPYNRKQIENALEVLLKRPDLSSGGIKIIGTIINLDPTVKYTNNIKTFARK